MPNDCKARAADAMPSKKLNKMTVGKIDDMQNACFDFFGWYGCCGSGVEGGRGFGRLLVGFAISPRAVVDFIVVSDGATSVMAAGLLSACAPLLPAECPRCP